MPGDDVPERLIALLRERGAAGLEHPGGTLLAHLVRVRERLLRLGAGPDLQHAGLAHAVYGTDGFPVTLIDPAQRDVLRDVAGPIVEATVYRYGACDRARTWPDLARTGVLHDRFDGSTETLSRADLRDLVDLTIVNELDVVEHSAEIAARFGDELRVLFGSWAAAASPAVAAEATRVLS
jgi:hypothetical protein